MLKRGKLLLLFTGLDIETCRIRLLVADGEKEKERPHYDHEAPRLRGRLLDGDRIVHWEAHMGCLSSLQWSPVTLPVSCQLLDRSIRRHDADDDWLPAKATSYWPENQPAASLLY